jgi:hypothetical protein
MNHRQVAVRSIFSKLAGRERIFTTSVRRAGVRGMGTVFAGPVPMRGLPVWIAAVLLLPCAALVAAVSVASPGAPQLPQSPAAPAAASPVRHASSVLDTHLLVTWYGNPWSGKMGILGRLQGKALAEGLRRQANAYAALARKRVMPAYELVAVIAQPLPGRDGMYRRRESRQVIDRMLREARAAGFKLILDIQTGRSTVLSELAHLAPYLQEPDVYIALDPEFSMGTDGVPGRRIGEMRANEVNDAIGLLEYVQERYQLPPKVLIVHQFTTGMLPDKEKIWSSSTVDIVLAADGFGPPALKRNTYRAVLRQHSLAFSGFKLFYIQDTDLLDPSQVLALSPPPAVIIYQ